MICKTGKSPSELLAELEARYGRFEMVEFNLPFAPEAKDEVVNAVMVDRILPEFMQKVTMVSYEDGCKVYFDDNSFVICRFSGTEPLLRIFAEGKTQSQAQSYIDAWKNLLKL